MKTERKQNGTINIPGRYRYTVTLSDGTVEETDSECMSLDTLLYELDKCSIDKLTVELNPAWLAWPCTKH